MIDILLSIFFGSLVFLSAIATIGITIAFVAVIVWVFAEMIKDIFD